MLTLARGGTAIFRSKVKDNLQFLPHLMVAIRRDGFTEFIFMMCKRIIAKFSRTPGSHHIGHHEFDRRFGTETATAIPRWRIRDVSSPNRLHATNYVPSREDDVLMLFQNLPIDPREFTCIDFGSGKGKVLLLAAEFGFRKIIGIEFSPSLHATAKANIERYKAVSNRDCEIECVCQDAAEFPIPIENLVIFLFGPFHEPVFQQVVDKLRHSLKTQERPIYVINFGSPLAQAIRKVEFLKPLPGRAGKWIYSNRKHLEVAVEE